MYSGYFWRTFFGKTYIDESMRLAIAIISCLYHGPSQAARRTFAAYANFGEWTALMDFLSDFRQPFGAVPCSRATCVIQTVWISEDIITKGSLWLAT